MFLNRISAPTKVKNIVIKTQPHMDLVSEEHLTEFIMCQLSDEDKLYLRRYLASKQKHMWPRREFEIYFGTGDESNVIEPEEDL